MEAPSIRTVVSRALKAVARLALAISLFALLAPSPATAQPHVCKGPITISV